MLKPLDVVCFGVLSAMRVATVEEYPNADSGATILSLMELSVIYTNHSGTYHLPAHKVRVANTAGAGAAFSAGLIFGRVQSWPDDEAVAFANALAGLYCSVPTGISSATEVKELAASRGLELAKLC